MKKIFLLLSALMFFLCSCQINTQSKPAFFNPTELTYEVHFHPNGVTGDEIIQKMNLGIANQLEPLQYNAPVGMRFGGWNTKPDGSGDYYNDCQKSTIGSSNVNLYNLGGVEAYFYGFMAPSTGLLKYYGLEKFDEGFVIIFPGKDSRKTDGLNTSLKLFRTLDDSRAWSKMLGIGSVGQLNDAISMGKGQEIILLQEAMMEERIGRIAEQILQDRAKKFILVAGPSSSGKTSFANRLSIQLISKGLRPYPVSLDDYYLEDYI